MGRQQTGALPRDACYCNRLDKAWEGPGQGQDQLDREQNVKDRDADSEH